LTICEEEYVNIYNIKTKFGKGMWDNSDFESSTGLVKPLKIIKLPANRSPPRSVVAGVPTPKHKNVFFLSAINSVRGSINTGEKKLKAKSPKLHVNFEENIENTFSIK